MKYIAIPLIAISLAYPAVFSEAAAEIATPADQASSQYSSDSPEFKAAEDAAQRYMAAYNQGDAKTLADFYAEDVDYIDQDGAEVKGRAAIQKLLADNFQVNPGVKLDMTVDELKQLTPDVRVNRGNATVTPKDGAAVATRYVAINVKTGDRWLISQLTETEAAKCVLPAPGTGVVSWNLGGQGRGSNRRRKGQVGRRQEFFDPHVQGERKRSE